MLFGAYPDPIAFRVGAFGIHWYAILILIGASAGTWVALYCARVKNIASVLVWDFVLIVTPVLIICGRLAYVLSHLGQYPSFASALRIWEGGMSIHGAIGGAILAAIIFARLRKISVWTLLDVIFPGAAIAYAIGRWGNYFNQEVFGPSTDVSWGVPIDVFHRPVQYIGSMYFHPTWLYESLWSLVIFFFLFFLFKKLSKIPGVVSALYMMLYYAGRFGLEFLRLDSVYLFGQVTATHMVSVVAILLGAVVLYFRLHVLRKQATADITRDG